jgi:hypothetical protein
MTTRLFRTATVLWFAILLLAFLNGTLRELILIPAWGSFAGLLVSGLLLSACVLLVAWIAHPWYASPHAKLQWRVGAYWLLLTLAFEFGFGILRGKPWGELLNAYTLRGGNIWTLVLLVVLIAPRIAGWMRAQNGR